LITIPKDTSITFDLTVISVINAINKNNYTEVTAFNIKMTGDPQSGACKL
jgi:hypothetical protein